MAIEILIESQIQPFDNVAEFPATGAEKTIYIAKDINAAYYWNGSAYILIIDPTEVLWGDIGGDLLNQSDLINALNLKVDKVAGKGLSTEDYTTAEKSKLAGIQAGAEVNVNADWNATSGDAEILNKPNLTIYATNSALTSGLATKQDVLGFTPVSTARTLTINGVTQDLSADRTFTIPTDLTIGTTPIASGTIGRVLFEGTGNVLQQSSSLFWDGTNNRLGIGTSSPTTIVHINGNAAGSEPSLQIRQQANTTPTWFAVRNTDNLAATGAVSLDLGISGGTGQFFTGTAQGDIVLKAYSNPSTSKFFLGTGNTAQMVLFPSTNNIGINTTTDAGFKLDVNGNARVQTSLEIAGATGLTLGGGASALAYSGNILNIGNSASWGDVRLFAGGVQKFSQTSSLTTIANTTINLSTATVQLAGVNALTYSGTDIRIGSVAAGFNSLSMYVAGSERARIASTGNLLINTTTDAGFRLDVNGSARVQGDLTIQNNSSLSWGNGNFVQVNNATPDWKFYVQSSLILTVAQSSFTIAVSANTRGLNPSADNTHDIGSQFGRYRNGWLSGQLKVGDATAVNASAKMQIDSTTQGFLPPRMTTTQRNAIASPAAGLMVYDTTLNAMFYFNGTIWI
jgi:hypothetical protein